MLNSLSLNTENIWLLHPVVQLVSRGILKSVMLYVVCDTTIKVPYNEVRRKNEASAILFLLVDPLTKIR